MSKIHEIESLSVSEVAQTMIFKTLWDRLPSKSFISGLWLREYVRTPLWKNCFLHVLSVKEYPYMRYYFGNIVLCTPGEKSLYEQASEEERISYALDIEEKSKGRSTANWDGVKSLQSDLIAQYKKSFPATRGMIVGYRYSLEEQQAIIGRLNKEFWDSF